MMLSRALGFALLALSSSTVWAGAQTSGRGPIAVMPWKNLSGDASLDWLKLGITETLVADLQKDGGRKVVERAALDQALAELALQASPAVDDSTAARAGKIVGAETVVVGGFQATGSGKKAVLRLTARFVDVESGVITDTAKIDGAIGDVFALQDQLVARLLKKPARARPKPKAPEQRAEAFRVYSLSLSTTSQAEQVKYLKEAIALDPDFVYAKDDLAALEYRLRQYRKSAARMQDEAARDLLAAVDDKNKPEQERAMAVVQAFGAFAAANRWYALRGASSAMLEEQSLPSAPMLDVRELSSYYLFLSLTMLKEQDLALQVGERHLKTWPIGTYARGVETQMQAIIGDKQRRADAIATIPAELADVSADEAKLLEQHEKRPLDNLDDRLRILAFRRCSVVYQGKDFDDAVRRCLAFAERYPADEPQHLARSARYFAAISHAELGRFDDARIILKQLGDEDAVWARSMAIPTFLTMWPE